MPLYNRLKEYRAKLGVNQQEMGALVQTSRQTISQIERGDYSPSVTLALKIAKVCGASVEDIFQYEDVIVDIESRITTASYLPCVIVFVGLVLFPVCIYAVDRTYSNSKGMPMTIVSEVVFVVSMILYCAIEKLVIDEEKKLNPEKKGNIFDINFRRDWEKSSDEAELIAIAKSSKKGFMAGIKVGFVMWMLMFVSMFAFDTGVMPIVAVGLVLIVMYVAYCREFVRLQK